jgi:group I intron endonuclease
MTSGIYKLEFSNGKVYIGQSGNCELRFSQHKRELINGTHTLKMQQAYNMYGLPSFEVIAEETNFAELNKLEKEAIELYDSINMGYNTCEGGSSPYYKGEDSPNSKYKKEDYWNVLYFLSEPGYSWKEISSLTGVSEYVISHISNLESHNWLEDEFPILYKKLKDIRNSDTGRMSAFMQGITYPKIVSPSGEVFEVKHCSNFAKEHNLLQPKLHEVLTGSRNHHRGWHLEGYIQNTYPRVRSPDNEIYDIPFKGAAEFARTHNLTHSILHSLLKGRVKSHKGWTLA